MLPANPTMTEEAEQDLETYLLLLLSDSNLPTGGFVASSGLESFFAHGLLHNARFNIPTTSTTYSTKNPNSRAIAPSQAQLSSATLSFAKSTLHSYARSSFPFLARVHYAVERYLEDGIQARLEQRETGEKERLQQCLGAVSRLDYNYHTLLLNHVARRASKAQGIALLTLYSKAFARPINLASEPFDGSRLAHRSPPSPSSSIPNQNSSTPTTPETIRIELAAALVDRLKLDIRRSSSTQKSKGWVESGGQHGHLPICWAVFGACLGLSLQKSVYLHLFLQARSLFSSSVRLGTLGPYLAHQVMRFQLRGVVEDLLKQVESEGLLSFSLPQTPCNRDEKGKGKAIEREMDEVQGYTIAAERPTSLPDKEEVRVKTFRKTPSMISNQVGKGKVGSLRVGKAKLIPVDDSEDTEQGWAWDWPEDSDPLYTNFDGDDKGEERDSERGLWTQPNAPATTYPLGEIVQARHDGLHSRLFNS